MRREFFGRAGSSLNPPLFLLRQIPPRGGFVLPKNGFARIANGFGFGFEILNAIGGSHPESSCLVDGCRLFAQ